jgi:hypothetical protein
MKATVMNPTDKMKYVRSFKKNPKKKKSISSPIQKRISQTTKKFEGYKRPVKKNPSPSEMKRINDCNKLIDDIKEACRLGNSGRVNFELKDLPLMLYIEKIFNTHFEYTRFRY